MSAYVVERYHIIYLVKAAENAAIRSRFPLQWGSSVDHRLRGRLEAGEAISKLVEIAQMLWDENRASVSYHYPDGKLPGPTNEDYIIREEDFEKFQWIFTAAEVFRAIDCYQYQSCEHPGWRTSEAKAFTDALRVKWTHLLPGWDDAPWGAPKPIGYEASRIMEQS